ncbi:hypothetical protein LINPERPRIM_LOCUS14096 [Linum perenne]
MATASIQSSPSTQDLANSASSPHFSPGSDKRFWSALRGRIDSILDKRHREEGVEPTTENSAKRRKEDALLLLRGFDSVSHTLSSLSNNLDNALQGARSLAEPPTLTELLQAKIRNNEKESGLEKEIGVKRKLDSDESDNSSVEEKGSNCNKLKKAKNLAVSMAKKAAAMARELKSMKSDLCFVQERCALLEEENTRLRDGFSSGIQPEEDDLMRLQMETLLAEKSRLANENANLSRENQTLNQLVEYHQLSSQDLSESYEQLVQGIGLDFSSPDCLEDNQINNADDDDHEAGGSPAPHPSSSIAELSTSLDKYFEEEQ